MTPVGSVDLVAEVARCRYGEPTLGTQSIQWPEASCTELHEDAEMVRRHIYSILKKSSTEAYPVFEQLQEVVRSITEAEDAVRSAKQLEEDLASDGNVQVDVNGLVKAAGETQ